MRIKKILSQHKRDFRAIFECEHCDAEYVRDGYDDANFHENVIPSIICKVCKETSGDDYRPLTTKYAEGEVI